MSKRSPETSSDSSTRRRRTAIVAVGLLGLSGSLLASGVGQPSPEDHLEIVGCNESSKFYFMDTSLNTMIGISLSGADEKRVDRLRLDLNVVEALPTYAFALNGEDNHKDLAIQLGADRGGALPDAIVTHTNGDEWRIDVNPLRDEDSRIGVSVTAKCA